MTVLESLLDRDIAFAVLVSNIASRPVDYCLVAAKKDFRELQGLYFTYSQTNRRVVERGMSKREAQEFKEMLSEGIFVKVKDNQYGRIYELRDQSLKKRILNK